MALIECKECGSKVSDTALKCTSCGFQLRKPSRTMMGKIFKWAFVLFNILMLIWIVGGVGGNMDTINNGATEAHRAGAAIGTGIGAMMLLTLWVIGDIILGLFVLFTRPKS